MSGGCLHYNIYGEVILATTDWEKNMVRRGGFARSKAFYNFLMSLDGLCFRSVGEFRTLGQGVMGLFTF